MNHAKNVTLLFVVSSLLSPALAASCLAQGKAEPGISAARIRARKELGMLGVEYNRDSFVKQAREGDAIAVKLLIAAGMNPNFNSSEQQGRSSPLIAAIQADQVETVQILLSEGADPNRADGQNRLPLVAAFYSGHSARLATLLLDAGADVNAKGNGGTTPLMDISPYADVLLLELLLKRGADVNAKDNTGATVFMHAARALWSKNPRPPGL